MNLKLFTCEGGHLVLPDKASLAVSREDGGNLWVVPPREVWERSELSAMELTMWSFLVAAAGTAMLDTLPQLEGGCLNYWEAGNWALNDQAEPKGPKIPRRHRSVHLHLLGRSRTSQDPAWRWGEAPKFPDWVDRHTWASKRERLHPDECARIVERTAVLLKETYGMNESQVAPWAACEGCGYPMPRGEGRGEASCAECWASTRTLRA